MEVKTRAVDAQRAGSRHGAQSRWSRAQIILIQSNQKLFPSGPSSIAALLPCLELSDLGTKLLNGR